MVKALSSINKDDNKKPAALQTEIDQSKQDASIIPFAENRMKGQFSSMTKDLVKKAQEALILKKAEELRRKEEIAQKKER